MAIIGALAGEPRRFDELVADLGVPRSTLASRLRRLVAADCLHRRAYQQRPVRYEYRLTARGFDLGAIGAAAAAWDARWRSGSSGQRTADAAVRSASAGVMCATCGRVVTPADVRYSDDRARPVRHRFAGRRARVSRPLSKRDGATTLLEDRWSGLIIAAMFFGVHRFADLAAATRIAPNILSARLRALVGAGLLVRRQYHDRPPRHDYVLAEAGLGLYPLILALVRWGERWLRPGHGETIQLVHSCGGPI